jgi:hypothetical protein
VAVLLFSGALEGVASPSPAENSGHGLATSAALPCSAALTKDQAQGTCPESPSSAASLPLAAAPSLLAWSEVKATTPGNLSGAGLVADPSLSTVVQFGGASSKGLSNVTALYNESVDQWTTLETGAWPLTPSPSPRSDFGFAGDAATHDALLFGGAVAGGSAVGNDTWLFHFQSATWTNVSAPTAPAPREDPALAVDPSSGLALLYGGENPNFEGTGVVTFSDTWEFAFATDSWSRVATGSENPPALYGAKLVWDAADGAFDLFGGCYPCSDRVWTFDPASGNWTGPISTTGTPPTARMQSVWAYEPELHADLLYGGFDGSVAYADTYLYEPTSDLWVPEAVPLAPPARYAAAADWLDVPGNATLLMTGGTSVTDGPLAGTWRLGLSANLSVEVLNASDGAAIPHAVVATGLAPAQTTNAAGYVNLSSLPSAEAVVRVAAPGFAAGGVSEWLSPGTSTSLVVGLEPVPPAVVDVYVADSFGVPLGGILVNLTVEQDLVEGLGVTNAFGWANFTGIPAFPGNVTAYGGAYHPSLVPADFASGALTVVDVVMVHLAVVQLRVTGQLPNATTVPLGNASVLLNGTLLGLTDPYGYLNATTDFSGDLPLVVTAAYFYRNSSTLLVPVTGEVFAFPLLRSAPLATLELRVVDAHTLLAVPVAQVNFTETPALAVAPSSFHRTTVAGTLSLSLLGGNYTVHVWALDYLENDSTPVQWLKPDATDSLVVLLTPLPRSSLDALVLNNSSLRPVAGASVSVDGGPAVVSNALGWANVTGLLPGVASVLATAPGYYANQTTVTLHVGQNLSRFPIRLTPAPGSPARGGQNSLTVIPPGLANAWALLLLPLAALGIALVYLTMLRAPEAPPPAAPPEPGPTPGQPSRRPARRRRRPRSPPPGP